MKLIGLLLLLGAPTVGVPDGERAGKAMVAVFRPRDVYADESTLSARFTDNIIAASERFSGKAVVFVGHAVPNLDHDKMVLGFSGSLVLPTCRLKPSEKARAIGLHSGQLVVVSGRTPVRTTSGSFVLEECSIDYAFREPPETLARSYETCLIAAMELAGAPPSPRLAALVARIRDQASTMQLLDCSNPAVMVVFLCEGQDGNAKDRPLLRSCLEPEISAVRSATTSADEGDVSPAEGLAK